MTGRWKTQQDYYDTATERGYTWLGLHKPKSVMIPQLWLCSNGHLRECSFSDFRNHGCGPCKGVTKRTEKDYHAVAEDKGWTWLGAKLPKNTGVPTSWLCEKGHKQERSYTGARLYSCRECHNVRMRHKKEDYLKVGQDRGIQWVGKTLPKNLGEKTQWRGLCGHTWETSYGRIQEKSLCLICGASNGETLIAKWLTDKGIVFEVEKSFTKFTTPRGGHYRYDFHLPKDKTLIEFHGEQHYYENEFFDGYKGLREREASDATKETWAEDNNYKLVIIPYWDISRIDFILGEEI